MDLKFVKPNRCDMSGPNCVEVARSESGARYVRDSKNPEGPMLAFTALEWSALEESIANGQRF